ncbi:MAG: thioredoxin-dependent thiol peroxidase [Breznakia sp.]
MLKVQTQAPNFILPDKEGNMHSLHDYIGKKVVVYFYPKDNTPGCTIQACTFSNAKTKFDALGVEVIGISKDSQKAHQNFIRKHQLDFLLLSDPNLEAIKAFDVWQEKKLYGKTYMGVMRSTFVIDETGKIIAVFEKASPKTNAQDILDFLKSE